MPARHDLLCGALDFLWKPWGSIELWEEPITIPLRKAGVVTKLVTDHPHLFETGGENYHCDFTAWDYQRGHEGDPWRTHPDPSWAGAPEQSFGRDHMPYHNSRGWFRGEADFPGPRTLAAATRWLEEEAPHHDRFLLFVDEFDPHEPFDTPEPYASMYDDSWEGAHLIWPPYTAAAQERGVLDARQAHQIRAQYGAKLTMIDAWFGKVLDQLDAQDLWDDTAIFVCTDHGHYLGERDIWGKPAVPVYEPLGHIPMMVAWPGVAPGRCDALTTTVDINATLRDLFGVELRQQTHGRSMIPLITGAATAIRDAALTGVWGREVGVIGSDGTRYSRVPISGNEPLALWSNRWSTMYMNVYPGIFPPPDHRATLDRMPGSEVPVIRQPFSAGDPLPYWATTRFEGNHLYRIDDDPGELANLSGTAAEKGAAELLREELLAVFAPLEQLERLGLS